ncbi:hypothetical protein GCM10007304_07180 [Rhodococcoides trifolii]|uniref:Uncharacterized protein n=1 Tax=Rhodococcoides trifolii TaxID=908250 RepID=A0A917FPG4_9NOCA|nr:hypothetical protein [Rhodococcus trifolii]GGF95873.1 hypothetical protein GCM10007304_07180 [Rhodococcus trifolii]
MTDSYETPISRPRVVTIVFWVWTASAVVLLLLGLLSVTISGDTVRQSVTSAGLSAADADGYVTLFRAVGALILVVGAAIGFMTGRVGKGDIRFRRALAALSMVFALVLIGATLVGVIVVPILGLLSAVLLLVAAVLSFRPSAEPWFSRD